MSCTKYSIIYNFHIISTTIVFKLSRNSTKRVLKSINQTEPFMYYSLKIIKDLKADARTWLVEFKAFLSESVGSSVRYTTTALLRSSSSSFSIIGSSIS